MSDRRLSLVFSALLLAAVPAVGLAQTTSPVGQWACEFAYTEFNQQGQRTSGHFREYMMAVYQNGAYEAGGSIAGADGVNQFQSQGQWRMEAGSFIAKGPERSSSPFDSGLGVFMVVGTLDASGASMSSYYEQADPNQIYVMNRTNLQCQRRG